MICAGDLVNGRRDACEGDSGGPLIISKSDNDKTAIIYGIVSFGFFCGRSDGSSPSVSTFFPISEFSYFVIRF